MTGRARRNGSTRPASLSPGRSLAVGLALCLSFGAASAAADDVPKPQAEGTKAAADARGAGPQQLFRGKVVSLRDALQRREVDAREEFDKQVALETPQGEIIPIVPDWRGRAFYQDKRLRNRDVELVGRRKPGVPYLQVLMIFTFDDQGKRQYTDYYCDICAFPMYEIKPCECCQGPLRLRFQPRDLPDYVKRPAGETGARGGSKAAKGDGTRTP